MKYFFYIAIITCSICCNSCCQRTSFAEYRLEEVDSIHISFYSNRFNTYICIKNQEQIDSLYNIIYNSTTKCLTHFYPNMEITLYGCNQKQVFGVSKEYIKGYFSGKNKYNLEEILKRIYDESTK